eukprot:GHVP01070440.1.p1 GENE.GHVP01070440.1~~GHVP01070440.1.p1  ORF type:complete len:195 (-),score=18.88 GHVP01070440.1:303-887(-)
MFIESFNVLFIYSAILSLVSSGLILETKGPFRKNMEVQFSLTDPSIITEDEKFILCSIDGNTCVEPLPILIKKTEAKLLLNTVTGDFNPPNGLYYFKIIPKNKTALGDISVDYVSEACVFGSLEKGNDWNGLDKEQMKILAYKIENTTEYEISIVTEYVFNNTQNLFREPVSGYKNINIGFLNSAGIPPQKTAE